MAIPNQIYDSMHEKKTNGFKHSPSAWQVKKVWNYFFFRRLTHPISGISIPSTQIAISI